MIDIDLIVQEAIRITKKPIDLLDPKFKQQNEFINDKARLKALFCTRRAAKSYTGGLYLVKTCLENPGVNCLFVALTRLSAEGIIWKDILKTIDQKHNLQIRFNESKLTATFPNGSVIWLAGCDTDEDEMNKLLGKKYKVVVLDESSLFTIDLQRLVYGILKPATADYRGTICMLGTSSNITRGLFYDITTGKEPGWKLFEWSAHDNPYVAIQWAEELSDIDNNRPLFKETPLYQQWYLNKWVIDTDKLVYKFNQDRNLYATRPAHLKPDGWTYVLGVDTGWEDDNAFVLIGFHENDKTLYVMSTYNRPKMTFDQVVDKINEYMADTSMPISKVIIDGANKQGVESMRHRSSIPFEYADKIGKPDFIEMLNADLIQAKIKINSKCDNLIKELSSLVWKTDGDRISLPRKEHPALPNHLCDAFLYAWRNGYHYQSEAAVDKIVVGSKQWYQKQSESIWERERDKLVKDENWPEDNIDWPTDY